MEENYKKEHEIFLSNLNGTSAEEVLLTTCITAMSIVTVRVFSMNTLRSGWFNSIGQSLLIFTPSVLSVTVLNGHITTLALVLFVLCLAGIVVQQKISSPSESVYSSSNSAEDHKLSFISETRSHLLLDTVISILAVDFPAYPRRFAKTETFGCGYMDCGVGLFVVIAGLVTPETRETANKLEKWQCLWKTIKSSSILFSVGMLRILFTRLLNYQEHVTEYGEHWNFFLTLAVTRVMCSCILLIIPVTYTLHWSVLSIILYQFALSRLELTNYIFNDERRNILEANKEGLFSLIGYISSYMGAVYIGRRIAHNRNKKLALFSYLLLGGIALHGLMHFSSYYIQPVSRRIFNLTYFLWVISILCFQLSGHLVIDYILQGQIQCELTLAINKNGFFFFIVANILTGVVNLSINTISSSATMAVTIVTIYMFINSIIVLGMYRYNTDSSNLKTK